MIIYFQSTAPAFLSPSNIGNLAEYTAMTAIIAAGLVMVLISGEVDLSVGQVYALSPFVMYFAQQAGVPFVPAIGIGLVAAASRRRCQWDFHRDAPDTVFHHHSRHAVFDQWLHSDHLGRLSRPAAGRAVLEEIFGGNPGLADPVGDRCDAHSSVRARQDTLGATYVATGGNIIGAAEVGIKIDRIKIGNFVICSVLGGLAGILDTFRIGSIDPLAGGTEIMFMAIASSVIGGTLLTGGSGTIVGAFLGAAVLGILKDGFTLSGVSAYTFNVILGGAILITMLINVHLSRLRAAGGG